LEREFLLLRHGYSKDGNNKPENHVDANCNNDNDDDDDDDDDSYWPSDDSTDNENIALEEEEEEEDVFYDANTECVLFGKMRGVVVSKPAKGGKSLQLLQALRADRRTC
jgi:hypothetical protein